MGDDLMLGVRPAGDDPVDTASDRGSLEVRTRAIQHVVERIVIDTPGTVAHHSALGRLRGSNTPRADVTVHGGVARVTVDVACVWPCRVGDVASRVRDGVLVEATRMTGIQVASVDVTISTLTEGEPSQPERRRVE